MALTPRIRFQVLQRDGFTCRYCGQRPPAVKLHVDHIVPRSKGGSDDPENLLAACDTCNRGKAARHLAGVESERDNADPVWELSKALCALLSPAGQSLEYAVEGEPIPDYLFDLLALACADAARALWTHGDVPPGHIMHETIISHRVEMRGKDG